ncbi:hypothetical protein [Vibrio jasicida]|uniref:hypothetical protein n=1 Tax=Vibrio jasicida TaxID=766224 RepID=UPI000577E654|nr:hypothetical protein [Vibrio jasicida]
MKLPVIILFFTIFLTSYQARGLTVKWVGVVPKLSCSENPVSNQTDLLKLKKKCGHDILLKQSKVEKKESLDQLEAVLSFKI